MMQMEYHTVQTLIRMLLKEPSDLGLHCMPRPICPKILGHYSKCYKKTGHLKALNSSLINYIW